MTANLIGRRQVLGLVALAGAAPLVGCVSSTAADSGGQPVQAPAAPRTFVDEMMDHSQWFAPSLTRAIGPRALRAYVCDRLRRAGAYGFTLRGPNRTFIETSFLFGSNFDTDPQHAWAGEALRSEGAEMERAERIWAGTTAYQDKVTLWAQRKALLKWRFAGHSHVTSRSRERYIQEARDEVHRVFPEKAEYVGERGLRALIEEALIASEGCGLRDPEEHALVFALFLVLGHGCTHDPLFPPMMEAFQIPVSSSAERAERLRDAAVVLLRQQANV